MGERSCGPKSGPDSATSASCCATPTGISKRSMVSRGTWAPRCSARGCRAIQSMSPTPGLCPTEPFRGESLSRAGREPDAAEIERRREAYWQPYHDALRAELDRLRSIHGQVLLWEAHSIATVLPRLFEGELPDLNFGTNDGQSCAPDVLAVALGGVERTGG